MVTVSLPTVTGIPYISCLGSVIQSWPRGRKRTAYFAAFRIQYSCFDTRFQWRGLSNSGSYSSSNLTSVKFRASRELSTDVLHSWWRSPPPPPNTSAARDPSGGEGGNHTPGMGPENSPGLLVCPGRSRKSGARARGRPIPAPCAPGVQRLSHFRPFSPVTRPWGGETAPRVSPIRHQLTPPYALDARAKAARGLGADPWPLDTRIRTGWVTGSCPSRRNTRHPRPANHRGKGDWRRRLGRGGPHACRSGVFGGPRTVRTDLFAAIALPVLTLFVLLYHHCQEQHPCSFSAPKQRVRLLQTSLIS